MDQLLQVARHTFSDGQGIQRSVEHPIVGPHENVRPGVASLGYQAIHFINVFEKLAYLVAIVSEVASINIESHWKREKDQSKLEE